MTDTRHVHHATYDYPGMLFPNSINRPIAAPSIGAAVAGQKDDEVVRGHDLHRDREAVLCGRW